jgi:hypothetical protein
VKTLLQLLRAHFLRLKDHVFIVIEVPVFVQNPPLFIKLPSRQGIGIRRHHRKGNVPHLCVLNKIEDSFENVVFVKTESKHKISPDVYA